MSQDEESPISILDEADPLSLISACPGMIKDAVRFAVGEHPRFFGLDEDDFRKLCKQETISFTDTDHILRLQFWTEFHHTRFKENYKMQLGRIINGAISLEGFRTHFLKNAPRVAFMFTMPRDYKKQMELNLQRLVRNMSVIIDQPIIDPQTGKLDRHLAQMQIALLKHHEITIHGSPTQRIEQKTLALHLGGRKARELAGQVGEGHSEALSSRVKQLELRLKAATHVPKLSEWQKEPTTGRDAKDVSPSPSPSPPPKPRVPKDG